MSGDKPTWEGFAVSVLGSGHERSGQGCQDASLFLQPSADICFLIVADGAGSASLGQIGSNVAVDATRDLLNCRFTYWRPEGEPAWEALLFNCFKHARRRIETEAEARQTRIRELSTTLTVLCLAPGCAATASVGDCGAVVEIDDGELLLIAPPEHGEYANETTFLAQDDWQEHFRFSFRRGTHRAGIAFSDGLEHVALCRHVPYEPFVTDTLAFLSRLTPEERLPKYQTFLEKVVRGRKSDDDLSLVAAWVSEELV